MTGPRPPAARRILSLAWPMLIGQWAVIANGVIDNVMAGSLSAHALASIAVGASVYAMVYVCLLGTLQALAPLLASHFGAQQLTEVGQTWRQGGWLGATLAIPAAALLLHPWPLLHLAQAEPAVAESAASYLSLLALGLPAAVWFRLFTILNTALSRPRTVMAINLMGPLLKVPLNTLFMFGTEPSAALGGLSVPALGAAGCGLATALVYWVSALLGLMLLRRDGFYAPFKLRGWARPDLAQLTALVRLGLPIGATYLIEVTAFSLMTLLITRLGTVIVSGHAIAANLAVALYMIPVALGNATSILAAQALGAHNPIGARRIAWRGTLMATLLALGTGVLLATQRHAITALYTRDPAVAAVAIPLLGIVAAYHVFDALQCALSFILRAWRIALAPMLIFALALWGVGLGGGALLAHHTAWGAAGFWWAATTALALASLALALLLARATRISPPSGPGAGQV